MCYNIVIDCTKYISDLAKLLNAAGFGGESKNIPRWGGGVIVRDQAGGIGRFLNATGVEECPKKLNA